MIQALLFDFTNTLVELHEPDKVIEAAHQAIYRGLQQHALECSYPEFREVWLHIFLPWLGRGPSTSGASPYVASVLEAGAAYELEITPEAALAIVDAALVPWRAHTTLPPDVLPALDCLQGRYRMAVLSNFNHPPYIAQMLHHAGLAGFFSHVIVSGAVGLHKPDPAMFEHALAQLEVPPAASAMIGDSPAEDLAGAQAAGCHAILLDRQGRHCSYSGLRATSLLEVLDVLDQLNR